MKNVSIVRLSSMSIFVGLLLVAAYWVRQPTEGQMTHETNARLYSEQCFAGPHQKTWDDKMRAFCFYHDTSGVTLSEVDAEAQYTRRKEARAAEKEDFARPMQRLPTMMDGCGSTPERDVEPQLSVRDLSGRVIPTRIVRQALSTSSSGLP
jgi:hypothetical protein